MNWKSDPGPFNSIAWIIQFPEKIIFMENGTAKTNHEWKWTLLIASGVCNTFSLLIFSNSKKLPTEKDCLKLTAQFLKGKRCQRGRDPHMRLQKQEEAEIGCQWSPQLSQHCFCCWSWRCPDRDSNQNPWGRSTLMGKYLEILNIVNLRKTLKEQLQLQDFQQENKCVIGQYPCF